MLQIYKCICFQWLWRESTEVSSYMPEWHTGKERWKEFHSVGSHPLLYFTLNSLLSARSFFILHECWLHWVVHYLVRNNISNNQSKQHLSHTLTISKHRCDFAHINHIFKIKISRFRIIYLKKKKNNRKK